MLSLNNIDRSKIFTYKKYNYILSNDKDIILKDRYLQKYKYHTKQYILSKDLFETGFYEYQFKLRQYLTNFGLNRTTQLFGTCWFNSILNGILFVEKMKSKIIELLQFYKSNISSKKFDNIINVTLKEKHKLNLKINRDNLIMFNHIISILYKILCQEGLRNIKPGIYDNFNLTNLAATFTFYEDAYFTNIKLEYEEDKKIKNIEFPVIENINSRLYEINNVDFLIVSYTHLNLKKIPSEINVIFNNKKYLFKIEHCVVYLKDTENKINVSHAVSGFICNGKYYLYDSSYNFYYECNWLDLNDKTSQNILNFYKLYYTDYVVEDKMSHLYDKKSMTNWVIFHEYAVYYNVKSSFEYDNIDCAPKRI